MSRSQLWFAASCLLGLLVLLATALPAPFTIDDCNYLASVAALRRGTLFLPGTAGLPPSRALYAFEPLATVLQNPRTPVPPLVPPLYGLVAYPFSFLGWNGLVFLNVLACGATLVLLFVAARRLAGDERAGFYAALLWLLGASTVEYVQGLWPHMLAVALTTAGFLLVVRPATDGRVRYAAAGGFLLALAAGLRYQNAVLLGCGLVVLLAWGKPRLRSAAAFGLGALPLIGLGSLLNHARIGSWHPWSKTVGYIVVAAGRARDSVAVVPAGELAPGSRRLGGFAWEFFLGLWTRVVDYSAQPAFPTDLVYMRKLPTGDVVTMWGVLKKSWLQGSPWILVGLAVIGAAWLRRDGCGTAQRHLRATAVPIAAILLLFGLAGVYRHDGLTFNQRYFLELAPLVAIALAVALARLEAPWPWLAGGAVLGTAVAAAVLLGVSGATGYRLQSLVPLALAATAAGLWLGARARPRWSGGAALAIAACLAWSAVIHFATDLPASRRARNFNLGRAAMVEEALVEPRAMALVAARGPADAFCPLVLERDAVVVSGDNVPPAELPPLLDALLAKRRVLVWLENLPKATTSLLRTRYDLTVIHPPMLAEITSRPASADGSR